MSTFANAEADAVASLPRLSDQVLIGPQEYISGKPMRLAKHMGTGKYFRMGEREVFLLHRLDGQYSAEQIALDYKQHFGRVLNPVSWQQALGLFAKRGLIDDHGYLDLSQEHHHADDDPSNFIQPGPFTQKLWIWNPDAVIATLVPYCRWFINGPSFTLWTLAIITSELFVLSHRTALWTKFVGHPPNTLIVRAIALSIVSSLTMTLHEFGHAVACKRYGGEVREMGFLFRYLSFCAYTRIDDILLLPRRIERIYVLLIGPLISLSVIPVALLAWIYVPPTSALHTVAADVLIWFNIGCLIQLIPFLQFDGYFMLAQVLKMPDLRKDSYNYLLNWWLARVYRQPGITVSASHLIPTYVIYGVLSIIISTAAICYVITQYGRSLFNTLGPTPSVIIITILLGAILWRLYSVTLPWVRENYARVRPKKAL